MSEQATELDDLYQEVILDHGRRPRNFRRVEGANREAEGLNPLCGDHYRVYLRLEGDRIADVGFEGTGCAISKASASLMTGALKGKTTADAERLFASFHRLVTEGPGSTPAAVVQDHLLVEVVELGHANILLTLTRPATSASRSERVL